MREDHLMHVDQVADGVFRASGTAVNWYLLTEGPQVTLIDAGYPGDTAAVEASIEAIGRRPEDVATVLITHAHVDHIGAVNHLHGKYGTPVLASTVEAGHARREFLEQGGVPDVLRHVADYGVLRWSLQIARVGASKHVVLPHAGAFLAEGPLDLPGSPVPIITPGHTSGHTCFYLSTVGAVITGDTLVTGHPTSRRLGPQLLPSWFDHDREGVEEAINTLRGLDADLILPGHGEPWRGSLNESSVV